MLPDDVIRLRHILSEALDACSFAEEMPFDEFVNDRKTVKAIIRSIEVIGEAASKISGKTKLENTDIPWRSIVGMRNRLIHGYFDIDYRVVWKTVKDNLPPLISKLKRFFPNE
jgi:uncharacterized protein with HEPN domain